MKTDLTTNVRDTLIDLYHAADGKIGVYLEAAVHHLTLSALLKRKLIKVRVEAAGNGKTRHAALTRNGAKLAKELIPNIAVGTNSNTVLARFKRTDTRKRQPVTVHFDTANNEHIEAIKLIGQLKKQRTFTGDLIDFLTLDSELKSGDTFLLCNRYPHIVEQLQQQAVTDMIADCHALQAQNKALIAMIGTLENQVDMLAKELDKRQPSASVDFAHMMDAIHALGGKLDTLKALPLVTDAPKAIGLKPVQPVSGGLKPIGAAGNHQAMKAPAPVFEDDDSDDLLVVTQSADAGKIASANFLKSIAGLADMKSTGDGSGLSARQQANLEGN